MVNAVSDFDPSVHDVHCASNSGRLTTAVSSCSRTLKRSLNVIGLQFSSYKDITGRQHACCVTREVMGPDIVIASWPSGLYPEHSVSILLLFCWRAA